MGFAALDPSYELHPRHDVGPVRGGRQVSRTSNRCKIEENGLNAIEGGLLRGVSTVIARRSWGRQLT